MTKTNPQLHNKLIITTALCSIFMLTICGGTSAQPVSNCQQGGGIELGICTNTDNDTLTVIAQEEVQEQSRGSNSDDADATLNDQRSMRTADVAASSEAEENGIDIECDEHQREYVTPSGRIFYSACLTISRASSGDTSARLPTTREILYYAATTIHADGAGLRKRPDGVSYTNRFVPTIVSVTHPTQTHVVNLLGRDIAITLTATNYEYSWGDGTPNTVTTSPGLAWRKGIDPNNDPRLIRHYYTPPQGWRSSLDGPYPHEDREITLTTTWSGTATNPFTGESQTINGLVTTTETTGPFPLSHLVINNTDTWEEKQGH